LAVSIATISGAVTHAHVVSAIGEYDKLGPDRFFATHGFSPTKSYDLVWNRRRYPPKAIVGVAYELATGRRLQPGDFEGGKGGAIDVLTVMGFKVEPKKKS
jgi:hypothetical protein